MRAHPRWRADRHHHPDLPRLPAPLHRRMRKADLPPARQPATTRGDHLDAVGRAGRATLPRRRHLAAAGARRPVRWPAHPRPSLHHAGHLHLPRAARRGRRGPEPGVERGACPGTHRPADHRPDGHHGHGADQPGGGCSRARGPARTGNGPGGEDGRERAAGDLAHPRTAAVARRGPALVRGQPAAHRRRAAVGGGYLPPAADHRRAQPGRRPADRPGGQLLGPARRHQRQDPRPRQPRHPDHRHVPRPSPDGRWAGKRGRRLVAVGSRQPCPHIRARPPRHPHGTINAWPRPHRRQPRRRLGHRAAGNSGRSGARTRRRPS